jgi:hypothetical protein
MTNLGGAGSRDRYTPDQLREVARIQAEEQGAMDAMLQCAIEDARAGNVDRRAAARQGGPLASRGEGVASMRTAASIGRPGTTHDPIQRASDLHERYDRHAKTGEGGVGRLLGIV